MQSATLDYRPTHQHEKQSPALTEAARKAEAAAAEAAAASPDVTSSDEQAPCQDPEEQMRRQVEAFEASSSDRAEQEAQARIVHTAYSDQMAAPGRMP